MARRKKNEVNGVSVIITIIAAIIFFYYALNNDNQSSSYSTNSDDYQYTTDDIKPTKKIKPSIRVGANCKDGTYSDSTGRGACSRHGGVDNWIYN